MNNHFDKNWELLKNFRPPLGGKEATETRIRNSISLKNTGKRPSHIFEWKNVVLTGLFILISSSILYQIQERYNTPEKEEVQAGVLESFSWQSDSVYAKKTAEGYAFFQKGDPVQVGFAQKVSQSEREAMTKSQAMFVTKSLENFPYTTTLLIEHVKMMDVALRYHFFVEAGKETMHFSFDYPKLEYAEIFNLISTLDFKGMKPYIHAEQLYVTHGYGTLPFPVGLTPIENDGNIEIYNWAKASNEEFMNYLEKITSSGEYEKTSTGGGTHTFESVTGLEIVKISLSEKEIKYEFTYPEQGE